MNTTTSNNASLISFIFQAFGEGDRTRMIASMDWICAQGIKRGGPAPQHIIFQEALKLVESGQLLEVGLWEYIDGRTIFADMIREAREGSQEAYQAAIAWYVEHQGFPWYKTPETAEPYVRELVDAIHNERYKTR